jgi:hypothetical protein
LGPINAANIIHTVYLTELPSEYSKNPKSFHTVCYIYLNLVKLRLKVAPIFGLGASGAFLVFFFGEVSAKPQGHQGATRL